MHAKTKQREKTKKKERATRSGGWKQERGRMMERMEEAKGGRGEGGVGGGRREEGGGRRKETWQQRGRCTSLGDAESVNAPADMPVV